MEFERADLLALLSKLAIRLNELGIQGTFRIVGGAAIALKYSERPPTHDIDAEFISSNGSQDEIRQVIEEIASSEGLTPGWLNEFAMIFLPSHTSEDWVEFQQIGNIRFVVASAPLLLAMKLRAIRGDRDLKDIIALLKTCQVSTLADAVAIYSRYHGNDPLKEKAIMIITLYLNKERPLRH